MQHQDQQIWTDWPKGNPLHHDGSHQLMVTQGSYLRSLNELLVSFGNCLWVSVLLTHIWGADWADWCSMCPAFCALFTKTTHEALLQYFELIIICLYCKSFLDPTLSTRLLSTTLYYFTCKKDHKGYRGFFFYIYCTNSLMLKTAHW